MGSSHGPFSSEEASPLDTPADAARVARDFALFAFRLYEAASNGFLTPATFGPGVSLQTDRGRVHVAAEYTPLEIRKWAWNCSLAGIAVSAQAMDRALDDAFGGKPNKAKGLTDLDSARVIVYMIRCAFAHDPFNPRWACRGPYVGAFRVEPLQLVLDTRSLNGEMLTAGHLGGLDGYWKLLHFCCNQITQTGKGAS